MSTIIIIILIVAGIFAFIGYMSSTGDNAKDKAADAAAGAAGGAMAAVGCLVQLLGFGLLALAGLWVLSKLFGG